MIRNGNKTQDQITAKPEKYPQGSFKEKSCKWCGQVFKPMAPSHHYCSDDCKDDGSTNNYYLKQYGVGLPTVQRLFEQQEGKCAICGEEGFKMRDTHKSSLNLDHCHTTGKVRGLLCHNCNRALGLFSDNTERLVSAIKYLESATTIP